MKMNERFNEDADNKRVSEDLTPFLTPNRAEKLLDDVENEIKKRLQYPLAFEPYHSLRQRKHEYYKIPVGNFFVFYVVIDDVMEVRRFVYSRRDFDNLLP